MRSDNDSYFLAEPKSEDLARRVTERFEGHTESLRRSNRHSRIMRSWRVYFSRSESGNWDDTEITPGGEEGELTVFRPNEFRNLVLHVLTMATSAPPNFDPQAINTDAESIQAALLSRGLLDYYQHALDLAKKRKLRGEIALVCGESFLLAVWDPTEGEPYAANDSGDVIREGDFKFRCLTPYDFAYPSNCDDPDDPPWVIARIPENRWDLIEQYGRDPDGEENEIADVIRGLGAYTSTLKEEDFCQGDDEDIDMDDYVPVLWVYGKPSPALPDGRQAMVLDSETAVAVGDLEYKRVPGVRCAPEEIFKASGGYTVAFDLLALHEAYCSLQSTLLTAHDANGLPIFSAAQGANIDVEDLGAFKLITHAPGVGDQIRSHNLMALKPEQYAYPEQVRQGMERLAVVNATQRGQSVKGDSGAKAAFLASTANQFNAGFQGSLRGGDAALATHVIDTHKTHATVERQRTISGRYNTAASRAFSGKDLLPINRVIVHPSNPLYDTIQGRIQLLTDVYMPLNLIESPDQIHTFITTGRLEPVYEQDMTAALNIRRENEQLADPNGMQHIPSPYEDHVAHIKEHASVLDNPEARRNPTLVNKVRQAIEAHKQLWFSVDPVVYGALGFQPPPPPQQGQSTAPAAPPSQMPQGGRGVVGMPQGPVNPATGERVDLPNVEPPPAAMGG